MTRNKKIILGIIIFVLLGFGILALVNAKLGLISIQKDKISQEEEEQISILDKILPQGLEVGDLAPDFTSEDVYGNRLSLSGFRDEKPVLLVFWATWCGYCAKELPDLKAFTDEQQNEIQVIAVDSGESRETLKNYIQEKDINFLMLLDEDRKIWNRYFVRGTPSHFFVSSQGKIAALRPGLASKEDLEAMMIMLTELW